MIIINFMFNYYLTEFVKCYSESINNISCELNYGNIIKEIFMTYRKDLLKVDALENVSDEKLLTIIKQVKVIICIFKHQQYKY